MTAPYVFSPLIVLALAVGWWIRNKLSGAQIVVLEERLRLAKDRDQDVQRAREKLEEEVGDLKSQIAAGAPKEQLAPFSAKVDAALGEFKSANTALNAAITQGTGYLAMTDVERLRKREQWLREEIRAMRKLIQGQSQWGITVLAVLELNLYYIRKDAHAYLVAQHRIAENQLLPFSRWAIGTVFLAVLASLFVSIQRRFVAHHQFYRRELASMNGGYSGIIETPQPGGAGWNTIVPFIMMFTLPVLDLANWAFFYVGQVILDVNFSIPW